MRSYLAVGLLLFLQFAQSSLWHNDPTGEGVVTDPTGRLSRPSRWQ
jgi:hypothetical protein